MLAKSLPSESTNKRSFRCPPLVLGTPAPATVQADIREQTCLDCGRDAEGVISNCTCQLNDCSHACTAAACLISDIDRHVNLRARTHTLPISTYTPPPPTERRVQRARPDDKEERYFDQELEYGQRGPGPRQPPTHAPDATHTPHTHLRGPESPYPNPETTCLQAPSSHPQSASQVSTSPITQLTPHFQPPPYLADRPRIRILDPCTDAQHS